MTQELRLLRIFVASPSDVAPEREALENVIKELNDIWSTRLGIILHLVKWETHVHPGFGPYPQAVIDEQIGDDYDIFLGILWTRFGTPTPSAESGTEEEFNKAYSRHESDPDSVSIMIYFKDQPVSPTRIDLEQLSRVRDFQKRLSTLGGLYWPFQTPEEFQKLVRIHLSMQLRDWLTRRGEALKPPAEPTAAPHTPELQPDEEGFSDLIWKAAENAEMLIQLATRLTALYSNCEEDIEDSIAELKEMSGLKPAERIMNRIARIMENFANHIRAELPLFRDSYSTLIDAFGRASVFLIDFTPGYTPLEEGLTTVRSLRHTFAQNRHGLVALRQSIGALPQVTTRFNRAKRQCTEVLDDFDREMQAVLSLTLDLETLIERLLEGQFEGNIQNP